MKCTGCRAKLEEGKLRCPKCGRWQISGESQAEVFTLSELPDVDEKRIVTGGPWDAAWGGGFVVDSVTLYAGEEGAGKSTSLLQIACAVAELGTKSLYVSKEETLQKVKGRVRRLEIPVSSQALIRVVRNFTGSLRDLLEQERPGFLIIDSLPSLVGIGWTDVAEAVEILDAIKEYAIAHECPAIVVDHLNARDKFSGPRAFAHLIDITMLLKKDKKNPNHRTLQPLKSRDGAVDVVTHFTMTERGLVWVQDAENEENDEDEEFPETD